MSDTVYIKKPEKLSPTWRKVVSEARTELRKRWRAELKTALDGDSDALIKYCMHRAYCVLYNRVGDQLLLFGWCDHEKLAEDFGALFGRLLRLVTYLKKRRA